MKRHRRKKNKRTRTDSQKLLYTRSHPKSDDYVQGGKGGDRSDYLRQLNIKRADDKKACRRFFVSPEALREKSAKEVLDEL